MNKASIYETKNRLSQIVSAAEKGEPQIITKNGVETAVVISIEEYKKLTAKKQSLVELLLDNPCHKYGIELDLTRSKDTGRPTIDFSEDAE
ncbi:MAG: type II toxin-antitoxin system Phd/YefM family antitoxin [Blastocatellia bacterium]|nr:type II toxin-antitoxin system Phd/YefM family antitoxin [Blastocatellia bacterium]